MNPGWACVQCSDGMQWAAAFIHFILHTLHGFLSVSIYCTHVLHPTLCNQRNMVYVFFCPSHDVTDTRASKRRDRIYMFFFLLTDRIYMLYIRAYVFRIYVSCLLAQRMHDESLHRQRVALTGQTLVNDLT